MKYNETFKGEDFTIIEVCDAKETKNSTFYREIEFDKHPNPDLRIGNTYVPKVREFHDKVTDFIDISIGQVLHDVHIHAKAMNMKSAGRLYSLDRFDGNIIYDRKA